MVLGRRSFLVSSAGAAALGAFGPASAAEPEPGAWPPGKTGACASLSLEGARLTVRTPLVRTACRLLFIGDSHYATDDARGEPFRQYSKRMSGGPRDMAGLLQELIKAKQSGNDAVFLLGDMLNFPSEAGVEQLAAVVRQAPLPTHYIAGNHDWHYEGLPGAEVDLRAEWIKKRLLPLYGGRDPMGYAVCVGDVKVLLVDDSTYRMLPGQLAVLRRELADGVPTLLGVHIPFYVPWRREDIFFGVGHPDWNAAHDPYWEIERRECWPKAGHDATTYAFWREALTASNLLGVVAGHIHAQSLDGFEGRFQFVLPKALPREVWITPA